MLSLESFRRIIGYHPFHWWGLADSAHTPVSACNDIAVKYAWQNSDASGREDILAAIQTAEDKLTAYLRYAPALHFITEELLPFPQYHQTGIRYRSNRAVDLRWQSVQLNQGKVNSIGKETLTLIDTVTLTYSDQDGDGVNDTFTATTALTTSEVSIDNIDVYFSAANRLDNQSANDTWLISPVQKMINANGTVTILGRAWQCVRPILYEGLNATPTNPIDPTNAANFVTTLDVYRHFADPNGQTIDDSQAVLIWETPPYPTFMACCSNATLTFQPGGSTDPASYYQAVARSGIRDAENGIIIPAAASYDSTNQQWNAITWGLCAPPDRIRVRYRAGASLVNGYMQDQYQKVVARLACAELVTRPTACDMANRELYRWQFDVSRAGGNNDEQYRISNEDLNNPIGTRAGHIQAWKFIQKHANVLGVTV